MKPSDEMVSRVADEQLADIVRRLVAALSPRAVYLFGSHACGTPGPDSDIDIYITLEDALLERDDCDERAYACLRGLFLPIELHIEGADAFERRSSVVGSVEHDVRTQGRLLYAA